VWLLIIRHVLTITIRVTSDVDLTTGADAHRGSEPTLHALLLFANEQKRRAADPSLRRRLLWNGCEPIGGDGGRDRRHARRRSNTEARLEV
jgi:hypothetical protein